MVNPVDLEKKPVGIFAEFWMANYAQKNSEEMWCSPENIPKCFVINF